MCILKRLFGRKKKVLNAKAPEGTFCKNCKQDLSNAVNYSLIPTLTETGIHEDYYCDKCAIDEYGKMRNAFKTFCERGFDSPYLCINCTKCSQEKRSECLKKINKEI